MTQTDGPHFMARLCIHKTFLKGFLFKLKFTYKLQILKAFFLPLSEKLIKIILLKSFLRIPIILTSMPQKSFSFSMAQLRQCK